MFVHYNDLSLKNTQQKQDMVGTMSLGFAVGA